MRVGHPNSHELIKLECSIEALKYQVTDRNFQKNLQCHIVTLQGRIVKLQYAIVNTRRKYGFNGTLMVAFLYLYIINNNLYDDFNFS
jgi:hypothetical protein